LTFPLGTPVYIPFDEKQVSKTAHILYWNSEAVYHHHNIENTFRLFTITKTKLTNFPVFTAVALHVSNVWNQTETHFQISKALVLKCGHLDGQYNVIMYYL
jgi:hypothetical protein